LVEESWQAAAAAEATPPPLRPSEKRRWQGSREGFVFASLARRIAVAKKGLIGVLPAANGDK